jgi:4-diphosphocytidyl-2-C-methyl-D-erythritol kinase
MMMEGRGEILDQVDLSLNNLYLVLLFPEIPISTAEAYAGVSPKMPERHLIELIKAPVNEWKDQVVNDFEKSIFEKHPLLHSLKLALYRAGAFYASMSGSGSSVYGIFEKRPHLPGKIREHVIWEGTI